MKVNFNPPEMTRTRANELLAQDMEMLHEFDGSHCRYCARHRNQVPPFDECPVLLRCAIQQLSEQVTA